MIECDDNNIFKIFLATPETALFNMLTCRHIYCFYPSLLARNVNVLTPNPSPAQSSMLTSYNFGLMTFDPDIEQDYSSFPGMCQEGCYSKTRSLFGLEGVLVNQWGGIAGSYDDGTDSSGVSKSDGYELLEYQWRIGSTCLNVLCPYYGCGYKD